MIPNEDSKTNHDYPHHTEQGDNAQATAYRVDDDNLEEKDLKKTFLFGDSKDHNPDQPGYESHGMGGQSFGENSVTPSGDDEANPSETAGYRNPYFRRKEPMEEHPENYNFEAPGQQGEPNTEGLDLSNHSSPDQPAYGNTQGTHAQMNPQQSYQEGTADNDGQAATAPGPGGSKNHPVNAHPDQPDQFSELSGADYAPDQDPPQTDADQESLQSSEDNPGPNEAAEQQRVGGAPGEADYKPEYDKGTPDYGSNSPEEGQEHIET